MSIIKRKLEGEVEVHSAAGDVYYDIFVSKPHHTAHVSPHFVQACDSHDGELGTPGHIVGWKYTLDGKSFFAKSIIDVIDKENKLTRQTVLEGDLLKEYKSFVSTCQVIPKDKETSIVRWTIEYEKLNPDVPEPTGVLDGLLSIAKDAEDHHHRETK